MYAPKGHWLLGHIPAIWKDPLTLLDQCAGGVVPLRLGRTAWLILDPPDVLHVLENSEFVYSKGRAFRYGKKLYGNSLLVSEGEEHQRQVKQIGGLLFQHSYQTFLQPAVDITHRWLERWENGDVIDLWPSLVELTLAISSQAIFGQDYQPSWMTQEPQTRSDEILQSYETAMDQVARRNFSLLSFPDWVPTRMNRRYHRAIQTLNRAFNASVEKRLDGKAAGGFLDHLLAAHEAHPEELSRQQVRDQALVLLLGGYESTATALCWTLLLMSRHDSIRARLREEVHTVTGGQLPQTAQASSLKYVAQVFSESLRLYPPPWLIPRTASQDDSLPSGQPIRSGTQIFLSPYCTQRDARFFENPLQFDPQRFDPAMVKQLQPGSYFPFGLGSRHCLAESIGRTQATLILATIFQHHEVQLVSGELPRPNPLLTLRPPHPLPVRVEQVDLESATSQPVSPR